MTLSDLTPTPQPTPRSPPSLHPLTHSLCVFGFATMSPVRRCSDKTGLLSRQKYACRDKIMFVATKCICHDGNGSLRNFFFFFTCPVTALPVFYRRRLTLCTAPSTWSPRFTSHDLYLPCRSLVNRAKRSFYSGPPKINDSNSKLSLIV